MINLPSILHNKRVVASVPTYLNNIVPPIVSYTYPKTVASKVFNFKQATSNLNFEIGTVNMSCNCSTSPYTYAPAGHIVTGNLGIVKNKHVRKLLTKGPTYREQNNINWNRNEEICLEAIRKYRVKWAKSENIDVRVLSDWEHEVTRCIKNRIKRCKRKHVRIRRKQVLKTSENLEYVKGFQEQYVLVPADKAASNIIVVCKKHYLDMILSELTLNGSNTYIDSNLDCNTLISRHIHDMKRWNISIPSVMQGLPSFYWLPKMHKDPYGARFIAASSKCTTKPLSKLLTSCLSLVMMHFKEYCEGIYRNTGIHCFWIINNSQQVISTLKDINASAKAKHFDSYDFSTLYTSIPHDSLKNNMRLLIDEAFKVRGAIYLSVNKR